MILGAMASVTAVVLIPEFSCDYQTVLKASAIASSASLITSQLPDIDSVHSKVSNVFPLLKWLTSTKTALFFFITGAALYAADYMLIKEFSERNYFIFYAAMILIALGVIMLLMQKIFGHRKVTHSLLFNAALCATILLPYYLKIHEQWYLMMAVGGIMGLVSHLFFDCLTTRGCPLFLPFSKKNIKLMKLKSGKHDYIGVMISFVFLFGAVWFRFFVGDKYGIYKTETILACVISPIVALANTI